MLAGTAYAYDSYQYTLVASPAAYSAAEEACVDDGGHLASFATEQEYTAVLAAFATNFAPSPMRAGALAAEQVGVRPLLELVI